MANPTDADKKFLQTARERFARGNDGGPYKQRQRELEDLRFYAGDQWPSDVLSARAGQAASAGMPAVPARPCLTINKTRAPIRQVLNEERAADFGVELVPADDFGDLTQAPDDTEVTLREGLIRRLQRHSVASDARTWAFSRAAIAGIGWYRVNTKYVPGTWDQEISIDRIFNQSSVTVDPAHEMPDGSDLEWAFIGTDLPYDQYIAEYPGTKADPNRLTDATDEEFRSLGDEAPDWIRETGDGDNKQRVVRVVEYFYTVRTTRTMTRPRADGTTETRQDVVKAIKWAKIDGLQILDQTDWPSPHIPLIKVLGEELHPYDDQRRVEGMVRPAMDSARGFNYMVSRQVESVALAPLSPWIVAEGQLETYESMWDQSNTRSFPYLVFRQRDLEGNPAPAPQRVNAESHIEAISRSVAMFDVAIQATTMVPDPTLGHQDPSLRSGKAVERLVAQSQRGTSNYLDNLTRSMRFEAEVVNSLLYPIYGTRPGRLTRIMTGSENVTEMAQIGGNAARAMPPRPGTMPTPPPKVYRLSPDAKFNIAIRVTKNYETTRQEKFAILSDLMQARPELMEFFGDLYFNYMDAPGRQEFVTRMRLALNPNVQKLIGGQQPIPPQVQQQLDQFAQQNELLTKELQAKNQVIEQELVKAQQEIEITRANNETKLEIAKIQAGTQLTIADLKAKIDAMTAAAENEVARVTEDARLAAEQLRFIVETAEESRLRDADRAHEAALQDAQHDQEAAMAGVTHGLERAGAERDAELTRAQTSHEAAVQPKPPQA